MSNNMQNSNIDKQKKDKNNIKIGCLLFILICIGIGYFVNTDKGNNSSHINKIYFNPNTTKCPNFFGIYLGMDDGAAFNILKDFAKQNKLQALEYIENINNDKDYVKEYYIPSSGNDVLIKLMTSSKKYIGKIHSITINVDLMNRLGINNKEIFNDIVGQCCSGFDLSKSIIKDGNNEYINLNYTDYGISIEYDDKFIHLRY